MAASSSGFTLAGIPVRVRPAFFITIVTLGVFSYPVMPFPLTWVAIATVSVLVHELGHALAFRGFGLQPSISLHGMGGLTSASVEEPDSPPFTPLRSIVTSLAGPLSALVLFGVPAWMLAKGMGFEPLSLGRVIGEDGLYVQRSGAGRGTLIEATPLHVLISQAFYINIGWSLLNLIPVLPLDGGNVTASMIELVNPRHGRKVANVVSIGVAVVLAWWGYANGYPFGPLLAALLIGMNVSELASSRHDGSDQDLVDAARALVGFEPSRAEELARSVLARKVDGDRRRVATELYAWSRLAQGDPLGASHALAAMPLEDGPTATVRAAVSLALGRTAEGVTTMAWALAHDPDRSAKVLGAIAVAQSGQVAAVAQELLLLGPAGREGGEVLRDALDHTGHVAEARQVGQLLAG